MKYTTFYNTSGHDYQNYEKSHAARLDFLVEDLGLNSLYGKKIADVGAGLGFLYTRLNTQIKFNYYAFDGVEMDNTPFNYECVNLNNFESKYVDFFDYVICAETIEHLTDIYSCLFQIKKMLKVGGILYLTIPTINVTHNTIYPALIYPLENFIEFLGQMAFAIQDHRIHDKCFQQHVLILINQPWSESKMKFSKLEEKFHGIPPHISVNL